MNKEESYALFNQGLDAWNKWAYAISNERPEGDTKSSAWKDWEARATADFQDAVFSEPVDFSGFVFPARVIFDRARFDRRALLKNVNFQGSVSFDEADFQSIAFFDESKFGNEASFHQTNFRGMASFSKARFAGDAWFHRSGFESRATFNEASFDQDAWFDSVEFNHIVLFSEAKFKHKTWFSGAKFKDESWFIETSFNGTTSFVAATFNGNASFLLSTFSGDVDFSQSTFENGAKFTGVNCHLDVDFSGTKSRSLFRIYAKFIRVPNFSQASFIEPPPLHNIRIEPSHSRSLSQFIKKAWKGEQGQEARWRILKRLALQAHDHIREQEYHAQEIRTRRGTTDRIWEVPYWLGVFYQIFSNFGQSIARPLWSWLFGIILSAIGYCHLHHYHATGTSWPVRWFETPIEIWTAALGLALHRGLPAVSSLGNRLPDYHSVLYDVGPRWGQASFSPSGEALLGQIQVLFSTAMIFLFLLALRNRFRMK